MESPLSCFAKPGHVDVDAMPKKRRSTVDTMITYACAVHPHDISKAGGARYFSRAEAMRDINVGGYTDFVLRGSVSYAGIRGTAYHALGRDGKVRCEQIADDLVRVWRLKE